MSDIKLSNQQYELVTVLWRLGEGSARDVLSNLEGGALAYTTVATILTRLEKKGVLTSEVRGRERVFRPLVSEASVQRSMVGSLVETLFKGDPQALLAHMVREGDIQADELEGIKDLLDKSKNGGEAA